MNPRSLFALLSLASLSACPAPADAHRTRDHVTRPAPARPRVPSMLPIVSHAGRRWAVLSSHAASRDAVGAPSLVAQDPLFVTTRALRPAALRGIAVPREVHLGVAGARCALRTSTPVMLSRVAIELGEDDERVTPEALARIVDAESDGGRLIAAELSGEGCADARFASPSPREPTRFEARPLDGADRAEALRRFRATRTWRSLQRDASEHGDARPWDERSAAPEVVEWRRAEGGRSFVTVRGEVPFDGCGTFSATLWMTFERVGARLVARGQPLRDDGFSVTHALDGDADGAPEFLGDNEIRALRGGRYDAVVDLRPALRVCPC